MRSEMMRAWLLLLPLATRGLLLSPGMALRCARSRCPAPAVRIGDEAPGFLAEDELGDWVNLDKSSNLGASATGDMPAEAAALIARANESPESIEFEDTIGAIDAGYDFTSVAFEVGPVSNAGGTNMGSAKIFSLAKLGGLSADATLHLFGRYYRDDVLKNPDGDDHANIRAFQARAIRAPPGAHPYIASNAPVCGGAQKCGWDGVSFPWGLPISAKIAEFGTDAQSVEEALERSSSISGTAEWDPDSDIWIP